MHRRFALFAALVIAGPAGAVCFPESTYTDARVEFARSALVVSAQVADEQPVVDPGDPDGIAGTRYTMRVIESFKGDPPKSLLIWSENTSARFPMDRGRTYLLFLDAPREGAYSVNNCGQSSDATARSDVIAAIRAFSE